MEVPAQPVRACTAPDQSWPWHYAGAEHLETPTLTAEQVLDLPYPHTRIRPKGLEPVPLSDELRLEDLQAELETAATEPGEYIRTVNAISARVAKEVHRALRFHEGAVNIFHLNVPPAVENLSAEQHADCYGHTVATSLILTRLGVDHKILFVNGHAAVGLFHDDDTAFFVDPSNPNLSQRLDTFIPAGTRDGLDAELYEHGRAVTSFRAAGFGVHDPHFNPNLPQYAYLNVRVDGSTSSRLIMSIFPSGTGRTMLTMHAQYKRAVANKEFGAAAEYTRAIDGLYPEMDARSESERTDLTSIITYLCSRQEYGTALEVIDHRLSGMRLSLDPRFSELAGKSYALIVHALARHVEQLQTTDGTSEIVAGLRQMGLAACVRARNQLEEAAARYQRATRSLRPPEFYLSILAHQVSQIGRVALSLGSNE